MNKNIVLTVDFGTQSCRVSLINAHGDIVAIAKHKYHPVYVSDGKGQAENDPQFYFDIFLKATKQLIEENKDKVNDIVAFSLTCFRDSAVLLDENYKPLHNCVLWLDQRTTEPETKVSLFNRFLASVVGMKPTIDLNRKRTMAIWYQKHRKELWNKTKYYAPISSFFTYLITGKLVDSPSNCTGHYPLNYKKGIWYTKKTLKNIYDIPNKMLIDLLPPGTNIGTILDSISEACGLPKGIPFILTGSDKSTDTLGVGAIENDIAAISYGTACTVSVTNQKYYEPETFLPAYSSCVKGYYNLEVQIYRGYWMLSWFSEQFANEEVLASQIEQMTVEEALNKKIEDIPPGSEGLLLQPYWESGIKRPLALGSIVGFNDNHTKYHIYRAIIEGIGYALKEGLESIQSHQHKRVKELRVSGGGSQSDLICQITADIFNLPVKKIHTYETSSLGTAISVFYALNYFPSIDEAAKAMIREEKTFTPIKENAETYRLFYKEYLKLFPKLNNVYRSLRRIKN